MTARRRHRRIDAAARIGAMVVVLMGASAGTAAADPVDLDDVVRSGDTNDAWRLSLSLTTMTIDAVPNMADAAFAKEGYVTGRATATIDGNGDAAVNSGTLIVGVQVGCKVDLHDGLDLGIGNSYDVVSDDPYLNLSPSFSVTLKPGSTKTLGLGKKALKGATGVIYVHDAHVQVDGCGGAVAVRMFASVLMSTDTSDDSLNAYGQILPL